MSKQVSWVLAGVACGMLGLAGCESFSQLTQQQTIDRARLPLEPLEAPATGSPGMPAGNDGRIAPPPVVEQAVKGTYTFTVPETVTRVKRTHNQFEQYMLYWGQPKPTDVPFMVITVGPNQAAEHTQAGSVLAPENSRKYLLNGLMAEEWTGYTSDQKYPFCELLVRRGTTGDQLQAVAVARSTEMRQAALEILGSIRWTALP